MKAQFTSDGSRDFRQRYEGTFGFHTTESKKRLLVRIISVNEEEMKFEDKGRSEYVAYSDHGTEFEFLSPVKRMFDHRGKLSLIFRRPARQYQRGISQANTQILTISTGAVLAPTFQNLTCAFADEGFNGAKFKLWEKGERDEIVLSPMLGVAGKRVFLYNVDIGTVEERTFKVAGLFLQEVKDCVRDCGIDYKVEVA